MGDQPRGKDVGRDDGPVDPVVPGTIEQGDILPRAAPSPSRRSSPQVGPDEAERLLRTLRDDGPERAKIEARCAERARLDAYMIDTQVLLNRTLSRLAVRDADAGPEKVEIQQIEDAIGWAISDVLNRDQQDEISRPPPSDPLRSPYGFLMATFGMEGGMARTAAVRFNSLPDGSRQAFFRLILDQEPLGTAAEQAGTDPATMKGELHDAMRALFLLPQLPTHGGRDGASA